MVNSPADVLTPEELVALDAALERFEGEWPEEPPEWWREENRGCWENSWSLHEFSHEGRYLCYWNQYAAKLLEDGRVVLRRGRMFPSASMRGEAEGVTKAYDELVGSK